MIVSIISFLVIFNVYPYLVSIKGSVVLRYLCADIATLFPRVSVGLSSGYIGFSSVITKGGYFFSVPAPYFSIWVTGALLSYVIIILLLLYFMPENGGVRNWIRR
ncbi:hypothetical protein GCM10007108_14720 [Thermogymnomonas acidicola]|uniref:Uncharacterized protein n=1 Tax=Thermogymnomonas acidicola TaxID=399579 RepID=A0AA37BS89_9ARCH|nr:hypothetical protein [Thermogymnomonas acidicola]GGM77647.1 hypothetical protein GCM10007108_14720 [Thermogymnomonas acidicola]